ncbi:hypothetical protein BSKO_09279 [Bryopsis sp. KO-2023]|nr:hypothetical protein BSKO_09279 [Bryopsis sp. KO-2023]
MNKRLSEVHEKQMGFVEVADRRVSRVHCIISCKESGEKLKPRLEDCSSNGTFVNGEKVGKGKSLDIKHGDRISIVLSVATLVEQYFIYWAGSPQDSDIHLRLPRKRKWRRVQTKNYSSGDTRTATSYWRQLSFDAVSKNFSLSMLIIHQPVHHSRAVHARRFSMSNLSGNFTRLRSD